MKISNEELELFDDFLDSLYIKKKGDRKRIIMIYTRLFKKKKTIKEFEEKLEELGWDEITIMNISRYIINWNYRIEEDKKNERRK